MVANTCVVVTDTHRLGAIANLAKTMGGAVSALVIGTDELLENVRGMDFDAIRHYRLDDGAPAEALAGAVARDAAVCPPGLIVSSDEPAARMILGAIAGACRAAVVGSVDAFEPADDGVLLTRRVAGGKAYEKVRAAGPVAAVFVGADEEAPAGEAVEVVECETSPNGDRITSVEHSANSGLDTAARIVGVGMGVRNRGGVALAQGLAEAIDATMACSLPVCDDMHWFGPESVIGSSHSQVAPELYITLGISGSPNHTSGARDAKVIVAVNSDPKAGIFNVANYGIVGDVFDVVPELQKALAKD